MSKSLKYNLAVAGIMLALLSGLVALSPTQDWARSALIGVREYIFSVETSSPDIFNVSPSQLVRRYGFKTDTAKNRAALTRNVLAQLPVEMRDNFNTSDAKIARHLIQMLPREGTSQCGRFENLAGLVSKLTRSEISGCCSDYTEALIALATASGRFAREVRIKNHVFAEIYVASNRKWVWVDPLMGYTAEDTEGAPLSFMQLRKAILSGKKVWFFDHRQDKRMTHAFLPEKAKTFYTVENFRFAAMLLGNNLYAESLFENRWPHTPKAILQVMSYFFGIKPFTLVYKGEEENT